MEDREVDRFSSSPKPTNTSLSDLLDELCAYYMSIGVTYDEFWYGDYTRLKYYVKKHDLEIEQKNYYCWLQGLYVYDALNVVIGNAFSKRNAKKQNYVEKPIPVLPKTESQKEADAIKERQKAIESFEAMKAAWDKKMKKGGA